MRSTLLVLVMACSATAAPYRFLLVAGNQWDDCLLYTSDAADE